MLTRAKQSLYLPRDKAMVAVLVAAAGCAICLLLTPPERWLVGCFLTTILAWAAMIDIDRMILPDLLTLPLLLAGLVQAALAPAPGVMSSVAGAAVGYAAFTCVGQLFSRLLGRPALGQGDAKLLAAGGAWLGWDFLPYVMLIASSSALLSVGATAIWSGKQLNEGRIAFGPFVAIAIATGWGLAAEA
jgi:prepilin signal peptidase PulO-like enzyme (type II secretory pathway)